MSSPLPHPTATQRGALGSSIPNFRYRLIARIPDPGEPEDWDLIDTFVTPVEALRACSHCHQLIRNLLLGNRDPAGEADRRIRIHDAWLDRWLVWFDEASGAIRCDPALFDGPVPLDTLPD